MMAFEQEFLRLGSSWYDTGINYKFGRETTFCFFLCVFLLLFIPFMFWTVITTSSASFREIQRVLFVFYDFLSHIGVVTFQVHQSSYTFSYNLLSCDWILDAPNTSLFLGTTRTISPTLLCSVSYWLDTQGNQWEQRGRGKASQIKSQHGYGNNP